jgi:hypothetical protein
MVPPAGILVLIGMLALGLCCPLKPMGILRLAMRWPKFLSKLFGGDAWLRPLSRRALHLIESEPAEYARVFWYQVLIMRVTGVVALAMFVLVVTVMSLDALTGRH